MAFSWNEDQIHAIEDQDRSILVSAAAGSGKTAVLSQRILNRIKDLDHPVDVDSFLVLTFTRAAAAEMRERIQKLIGEEIEKNPENEHLRRQLSLINNAQISTIDSFCTEILHNYFHLIGLDPAYRIGEEPELLLLQEEALSEVLEEEFTSASEQFLHFMEAYAPNKKEAQVEEMVKDLFTFSQSHPYPKEFLKQCEDHFAISDERELAGQTWMKLLDRMTKEQVESAVEKMEEAIILASTPSGPEKYLVNLNAEYDAIYQVAQETDFFKRISAIAGVEFKRLPSIGKKDGVDEQLKDQVKALRDEAKKFCKDLKEKYKISASEELAAMKVCSAYAKELVRLTVLYGDRYFQKKQEKSLLDFSDAEHLALQIVREPDGEHAITDAARELSGHYTEIMIDEYQDSNYVQEAILTAIAKKDDNGVPINMFMVGDIKQSIYRFRMARPELFAEKYERFTLEESLEQKILLKQNYRSRDEVVDTVNAIFDKIMHKDLGNVEYDAAARLVRGREFVEPEHPDDFKTEILLVDPETWEGEEQAEPARLEARMIAKKIKDMVGQLKVTDADSGQLRPARYSDIVLLCRSLTKSVEYMEELQDYGVPVKCIQKQGLLQSREVKLILDLLSIIDNRRQDIPLTAVLYSPIVQVTEEELAMIRLSDEAADYYEAVFSYAQHGESKTLREKIQHFLEMLDLLSQKSEYLSLRELIEEIYRQSGYLDYASMLPAGEQRKANLLLLCEKAADYEKQGYKSLYRFIHYLSELEKNEVTLDEADLGEISEDVVTLMTIHKSKGLEFPIVFVCNMGRKINIQDEHGDLLMHADYGIGMNMIDVARRVKADTLMKQAVSVAIHNDNYGEEMRVLYVAMTRATDKLILTGTYKDCEEKLLCRSYDDLPSYMERYQVKYYLEWVVPAINGMDEIVTITCVDANELTQAGHNYEVQGYVKEILNHPYEEEVKKRIQKRLEWEYPFEKEMLLPTKVSVSELKHLDIEKAQEDNDEPQRMEYASEHRADDEIYIPTFIEEKDEVSEGALYGTAVHRYMELFDFTSEYADAGNHDEKWKAQRRQYLEEQKEAFVQSGRMQPEDAARLKTEKLEKFFDSEACGRMHMAAVRGLLYKEKPFVMGIEAREAKEFPKIGHIDSTELVLMQGIIDVFWEEHGEIVLLDYKTDHVQDDKGLTDRYAGQLDHYKKALERALSKTVKEKILYSFHLEKEIKTK
ncbi:MAG: helicase-exonuclease AddAB subunit AddA [Eubacterium sp.]|nr:helicase-exonuclease AddAB subunit AddA [Eubacterium sp.]